MARRGSPGANLGVVWLATDGGSLLDRLEHDRFDPFGGTGTSSARSAAALRISELLSVAYDQVSGILFGGRAGTTAASSSTRRRRMRGTATNLGTTERAHRRPDGALPVAREPRPAATATPTSPSPSTSAGRTTDIHFGMSNNLGAFWTRPFLGRGLRRQPVRHGRASAARSAWARSGPAYHGHRKRFATRQYEGPLASFKDQPAGPFVAARRHDALLPRGGQPHRDADHVSSSHAGLADGRPEGRRRPADVDPHPGREVDDDLRRPRRPATTRLSSTSFATSAPARSSSPGEERPVLPDVRRRAWSPARRSCSSSNAFLAHRAASRPPGRRAGGRCLRVDPNQGIKRDPTRDPLLLRPSPTSSTPRTGSRRRSARCSSASRSSTRATTTSRRVTQIGGHRQRQGEVQARSSTAASLVTGLTTTERARRDLRRRRANKLYVRMPGSAIAVENAAGARAEIRGIVLDPRDYRQGRTRPPTNGVFIADVQRGACHVGAHLAAAPLPGRSSTCRRRPTTAWVLVGRHDRHLARRSTRARPQARG